MAKRGRKPKPGPREPSGRPSRMSKAQMGENMSTVLSARMRHHGIKSPEDAKLPWNGCNAGRAIAGEPDAPDLWQRIKEIRRRRRAWLALIGMDEFPAISSVKPVSDYTHDVDPTAPLDPRPEEERAAATQAAWDAVANALYGVDPLLLRYVERAIVRDEPVRGPKIATVLRWPALRDALGG